ncbi:RNA-binding protein Ro60-like [Uloborus diversus]|uniref:RNA-binding protein Ro60-like n=1 Tax=Uloborus diversus TaxID=327109 RepID=UPI002409A94F|nr:RNA-binding protein Ro60-like [Uloborus diversus]
MTGNGSAAVLKYCMRGLEAAEKEGENLPEAQSALQYLKGVTKLCNEKEPETAARLIEHHDLCLEHVPTTLLKSKEVTLCLIPRLPLDQLLHFLPSFYKHNVLKPNTATFKAAVERLTSETALSDTSTNPLQTFLAVRRWQDATKIVPGKPKLNTKALDDALCSLHDASFKNVSSKDKRYLIALDVNKEMNSTRCAGCSVMGPSHVSDIILMALIKAELSNVTVVVFSETEFVSVDVNDKMTLNDIVEQLNEVKPGPVQLSAPISWALQKKKPFDSFLVFSDALKCSLEDECAAALKEYKETLHLPDTRFIMCSLNDRKSAFPLDKLDMLNIIGFNVNLLKIIQDFTSGVF